MEKDLRNNVKFILFCIECLQAGVIMTPKEYEVAFMAAEKFEGFDDKSFAQNECYAERYVKEKANH